jgi:hypothetical protein
MINTGVSGRSGFSGAAPAADLPGSGRRAAGVPAQEKANNPKRTQAGARQERPEMWYFILCYRYFFLFSAVRLKQNGMSEP